MVLEERRLRTDDSPAGLLYEVFTAAAFQASILRLPDHWLGVGHPIADPCGDRAIL